MTPVHSTVTDHHDHEVEVHLLVDRLVSADCPDEQLRLRDELVLSCIGVADSIAHRYRDRGVDVDDLEQVARAALVSACSRYDPEVGSGFLAFAVPSIAGELKRYFRDHTWSVRPPRRLQELRLEAGAVQEQLCQELGREPTADELAEALDVTTDQVHELRASSAAYRCSSLDHPATGGGTLGDHVPAEGDHSARVDTHLALAGALADLTERENRLLHLRFVEELTQREIGEHLGVSQMQVSRLLSGLLARLRPQVLPEAS
ncbi:sigma-70 family RNA polymerase sigma factor [Oryzobacter sp. R7]|uniref:sigma-70 family RNA polymerase sigma factor n=1 Tax=Oryzobacter faecalis TaxID=3388656 RepID=UPI00398CE471